MTPIEKIYFTSRIIHGDLSSAESELTGQLGPTGTWIPFIKTALMALGNLADLEGPMRFLYRDAPALRSEEHTSELQSLMRISYAVFCLNTQKQSAHDNTKQENQ